MTKYEPIDRYRVRGLYDEEYQQTVYRLDNGLGASIIEPRTGPELVVTAFYGDDDDFGLVYPAALMDAMTRGGFIPVSGHAGADVDAVLDRIAGLDPDFPRDEALRRFREQEDC